MNRHGMHDTTSPDLEYRSISAIEAWFGENSGITDIVQPQVDVFSTKTELILTIKNDTWRIKIGNNTDKAVMAVLDRLDTHLTIDSKLDAMEL